MISVDGLTVEFGGTTLFSDISFQINEKDRIALMGKNGAGKSTLLKILAGVRQPSRGKVTAPKDCVVAYLPQHWKTAAQYSRRLLRPLPIFMPWKRRLKPLITNWLCAPITRVILIWNLSRKFLP